MSDQQPTTGPSFVHQSVDGQRSSGTPGGLTGPAAAPVPADVSRATYVMYARAFVGVLGALFAFTQRPLLEQVIRQTYADKHLPISSARVTDLVNTSLAFAVVLGLIFGTFYVLLALQLARGAKWAWITTLVLSSLGILALVLTFAHPGTAVTHGLDIVGAALNALIVVLLARPQTRAYFAARPA